MSRNSVTGIILAGGASRRMGKDKGLCHFNGKQLVTYSIDILKPICENIIISSNNTDDYSKFGYPVATDEISDIGPIGGIYSGLRQSKTEDNLIISCDVPFLNRDSLTKILSLSEGYEVVIPQHENKWFEPLAGYYSRSIIPVLEKAIEHKDYKLINFYPDVIFRAISTNELPGMGVQYKNLNTPDDLL